MSNDIHFFININTFIYIVKIVSREVENDSRSRAEGVALSALIALLFSASSLQLLPMLDCLHNAKYADG